MERWGKGDWFEPEGTSPHEAIRPRSTNGPSPHEPHEEAGLPSDFNQDGDDPNVSAGMEEDAGRNSIPMPSDHDAGPPSGQLWQSAEASTFSAVPPDYDYSNSSPAVFFPPLPFSDPSPIEAGNTPANPLSFDPPSPGDSNFRISSRPIAARSLPLAHARGRVDIPDDFNEPSDSHDVFGVAPSLNPPGAPLLPPAAFVPVGPMPSRRSAGPGSMDSVGGMGGMDGGFAQSPRAAGATQTRSRRQDRRARRLALLFALLTVLVAVACIALLLGPALHSGDTSAATGQQNQAQSPSAPGGTPNDGTPSPQGATPTVPGSGGSGGPPAATPTPLPNGATVAFFVASKSISSQGGMTACATGCVVPGQAYSNSQAFTSPQTQSTQIPQTALDGTVVATNNGNYLWAVNNFVFSGNGWSCNPVNVSVPKSTSASYPCVINVSSPAQLPAHTIKGIVSARSVSYDNPQPLVGNGSWAVTSDDCSEAEYATQQQQGIPWAQGWITGQLQSGWAFALDPASATPYSLSNAQCPVNQNIQYFTVTITTHVSDGAFNIAAAQGVAVARLNGQVPTGYVLKPGSASTCSPSPTGYDASTGTSSLTCSDTGLAIYNWTGGLKMQLATSLLNESKSQALTTCNQTTGVKASSCNITIAGGGSTMPASVNNIAIDANTP